VIERELVARIRQLFYGEHWKVGTIASTLGIHHDTVERALDLGARSGPRPIRPSQLDPYRSFIEQTLERYPRLVATRIYEMTQLRGYTGGVTQLRRLVAQLRPRRHEAFLSRRVFPGEEAQVDWGHFGRVLVGKAVRALSCFVMALSYCRDFYFEFFFDQRLESFLRGHVRAFETFEGVPRVCLYDNPRSVVIERRGDAIHFNPQLIELSAHYHFQPRPCHPYRGNEKGRVERIIRYLREGFYAARSFVSLEELNRQARSWRQEVARARPWPDDRQLSVAEAYEKEKPRLMPLPENRFCADQVKAVSARKSIYIRFDLNQYSIPHTAIRRPLTLVASDTQVRILDGDTEVASHRRSWDRDRKIEDPRHVEGLLEFKRKARHSQPSARLLEAVPEAEAFLDAAFEAGESALAQTSQLLKLLDLYGPQETRAAIQEAMAHKSPRASSVGYLLARRRRLRKISAPLPVDLTRRPDLADLHVNPHAPETYDDLAETEPED
jgi:transposase